ncbi:hypothetical protein TNCV_4798461 [Trichonephila clavipes]|nr:hypothetical protein TNCV_4798461 [Trichonephila clavipes]
MAELESDKIIALSGGEVRAESYRRAEWMASTSPSKYETLKPHLAANKAGGLAEKMAMVAWWLGKRTRGRCVMSPSLVPLKTRRIGEWVMLVKSVDVQTSSCSSGVEVKRASSGVVLVT